MFLFSSFSEIQNFWKPENFISLFLFCVRYLLNSSDTRFSDEANLTHRLQLVRKGRQNID